MKCRWKQKIVKTNVKELKFEVGDIVYVDLRSNMTNKPNLHWAIVIGEIPNDRYYVTVFGRDEYTKACISKDRMTLGELVYHIPMRKGAKIKIQDPLDFE